MTTLRRQAFLDVLRRPDPAVRLWLVTGPDAGVAADLARRTLAALSGGEPGVVRDLAAASLADAPGRLLDEASTLSLFAERQVLFVGDGGDALAGAVALLLAAPQATHPVVMLAPETARSSPLKAAAAQSEAARLVECWPLGESDGEALVAAAARALGLRLPAGGAALVFARSGADPTIAAQELEKLALAAGASPAAPRDLAADLLDVLLPGETDADVDRLVEALLQRDRAAVAEALGGLERESAIGLLRAVARQLLTLAGLADEVAQGIHPQQAVDRHRPPLFRKLRAPLTQALSRWTSAEVARALDLLLEAERAIKSPGAAGDRMGIHALLRLALARPALGRSAARP